MSDFRDPREPMYRDPAYRSLDNIPRDPRAGAYSPGMAAAWFLGIALFIGVLIFAFGGGETTQVADTDTTPPAQTQPATPPTAAPPAATPPAQQPPAGQ